MTTPIYNLDELTDDQLSKYITHNTALRQLEGFGGNRIISRTTTAQPGSPSEGDIYLLPASSTGDDWAGNDGDIALYVQGSWELLAPKEGFSYWVNDEDIQLTYDGSSWSVTGFKSTLTSDEIDQLENIDSTTISTGQWSYVGAMDQGVATTDDVQFAKVLVGTSTGDDPLVIAREDNTGALASFERHVDGVGGGNVNFIKSRGTRSSPTIVQDGDILGGISAKGHDGSSYVNGGAIQVVVDGTPGTNDMPTAVQIRTTPDGSTTRTTRIIVKPDGKVMIGDADPNYQLDVAGDGGFENALTVENPASSTGATDEDADVYVVSKQSGDSTVWLNTTDSTDTKNVALVNIGNAGSRGHFQIAQGTDGSVTQSLRMDENGNILLKSSGTPSGNAKLEIDGVVAVKSYTVATLPTAISGGIIYVSDETGGATIAFSDGTNWRRASDRSIVS